MRLTRAIALRLRRLRHAWHAAKQSSEAPATSPVDAAPGWGPSFDELLADGTVTVGRHTYGVPKVHVYEGDEGRVAIGPFCSIGEDVEIFVGGNHRVDWVSTFPFRARWDLPGGVHDGSVNTRGPVTIGPDVWIGRGAKILSGVSVGPGAVIGAYAVVSRDVRPYAVVVGNPAQEARRRFDDATIDALCELAWWQWSDEAILSAVPLLSSDGVDELLDQGGPAASADEPRT